MKNGEYSNAKKLIEKHISSNSLAKKRFSCYIHPINSNVELNIKDSKRRSFELFQTKTRKFYQKYNVKEKVENHIKPNNIKNIIDPSHLNIIENNIKNVLSNMLIKIEKSQTKLSERDHFSPEIKTNKLLSNPSLKFAFTKKKLNIVRKKICKHHYLLKKLIV